MNHEPRLRTGRLTTIALSACLAVSAVMGPSLAVAATVNGRTIELITGDARRDIHLQSPRISGDGSLVAFSADASDAPMAAPGSSGLQVYAQDLETTAFEQISVDSDELGSESVAFAGGITPDARFVTFSDLQHPGNSHLDAYVRDRQLGITEVVSVAMDGGAGDGATQLGDVDISADGRYVVFSSTATNLVPGDTNGTLDVFLRDRVGGTTTFLSADSYHARISDDGSTIVFESVAGVFALDRATMAPELISVSTTGGNGDGFSFGCASDLSNDGRFVTFTSEATNLVPDDTNLTRDVFVRDRTLGTTVRVSVTDSETQGSAYQGYDAPAMSADGTKVAFVSMGRLHPSDPEGLATVYLRDLTAGTTRLISIGADGSPANADSGYCFNNSGVDIDDDGAVIAFHSLASNLVEPADPYIGYFDILISRPAPAPADGDADGISDDIDDDPATASTGFSDGTTSGQVSTLPAGFAVAITDAANPDDGVRVVVTGTGGDDVVLSVCGLTVRLPAGADAVLTCGSIIVEVAPGSPPVEVVIGGGLASISIPPGGGAEVSTGSGDSFTVENVSGGSVTVTVDGVTSTVDPDEQFTGSAWDFQGFASPIDNDGTTNVAIAGRTLPVRWRLVGSDGAPITGLATANLTVTSLSCATGTTADQVEEYAAGGSGLQDLGDGNYQVNWKTPKTYAGSCKTLRLEIGDGVLHEAFIRFTK